MGTQGRGSRSGRAANDDSFESSDFDEQTFTAEQIRRARGTEPVPTLKPKKRTGRKAK